MPSSTVLGSLDNGSLFGFLRSVERVLAPARDLLEPVLDNPWVLAAWLVVNAAALVVLWWDVRTNNQGIAPLMKLVWTLVVAYSGPFGLLIYWYSGRAQIGRDSVWRRGCRSTSHCYSGCGLGEITGLTIATIILSFSSIGVTLTTFAFAYTFGYLLTVGPLVQEGEGFGTAAWDAFLTETPSITVMEVAAIGTDLLLAGGAGWRTPLFWTALLFSLTVGFVFAYPVNVALIHLGVKEGMGNPKETTSTSRTSPSG